MLHVVFVHLMGNVGVPASGQGAVNGGSLGLGNGIKRIAITVANHHMDRQQLVVSRTVTCQRRPSSAMFQCVRWKKAPLYYSPLFSLLLADIRLLIQASRLWLD